MHCPHPGTSIGRGKVPQRSLHAHPYRLIALLLIALTSLLSPEGADAGTRQRSAVWYENQLPGTISWELTDPALHREIEGYASATSVLPGDAIDFHVSTTAPIFGADIYRMGYYGGEGARLMTSVSGVPGHAYPAPDPASGTGLIDCQWPVAFTLHVPRTWLSGMYLVKLTDSTGLQSYIPFVVRTPTPRKFLLVDSVNTAEAYNAWGGLSLYGDALYAGSGSVSTEGQSLSSSYYHRALEVSFDRPYAQDFGAGTFFYWEYHMVRWLEQHGYDVGYLTDVDLDGAPSLLTRAHGILIAGHSEYWSRGMRDAVQGAVDAGVNLGVFAGNTLSWQIRYDSEGGVPDRTIICYKDHAPNTADLRDPLSMTRLDTTAWRLLPVYEPESELLGASYEGIPQGEAQGRAAFPWVVRDASSWVYAGTGLHDGDTIPLVIGDEYDGVQGRFPEPPGLQVLSASPVTNDSGRLDEQNATLYTASSGARVFNASEIDWAWGLDDFMPPNLGALRHDTWGQTIPAVQTMTANILRNFAKRGTLRPPEVTIAVRSSMRRLQPGDLTLRLATVAGVPVRNAVVTLNTRPMGGDRILTGRSNNSGIVVFRDVVTVYWVSIVAVGIRVAHRTPAVRYIRVDAVNAPPGARQAADGIPELTTLGKR